MLQKTCKKVNPQCKSKACCTAHRDMQGLLHAHRDMPGLLHRPLRHVRLAALPTMTCKACLVHTEGQEKFGLASSGQKTCVMRSIQVVQLKALKSNGYCFRVLFGNRRRKQETAAGICGSGWAQLTGLERNGEEGSEGEPPP